MQTNPIRLEDCDPFIRAAYEEACAQWYREGKPAGRPKPQLEDFLNEVGHDTTGDNAAENGHDTDPNGEATEMLTNSKIDTNGHDTANDNFGIDRLGEPSKFFDGRFAGEVVELFPRPARLNGKKPPEQAEIGGATKLNGSHELAGVAAEHEQYLDRSVDLKALPIPLAVFPGFKRVIPERETTFTGWPAFIDKIAATPAPVFQEKKNVHYVMGVTLQEGPLTEAAQKELRRAGINTTTGKQRSTKCIASQGPAFLLDDDVDVFAREPLLRKLGWAACIYSSYSYGTTKEGATEPSKGGRVVLCLNRQYSRDEHKPLWYGINHLLGGGFDVAGLTAAQCYGIHARASIDAPHKRVVLDGAALNVDALIALGRQVMPAKAISAAKTTAKHDQSATIEEIRSAAEFLSEYLDDPEVLADEPEWMDNIARPFAHQASRCPDQREELERLLDELSQKVPGYDQDENAARFERYVKEAPERPAAGGVGDARTIASFFLLVRNLGWKGYVPPGVALDEPGHEAANRVLIQQQIIADPELFSMNGHLVRLHVPDADELVEGVEWKGDMPGTSLAKSADIMLCAERLTWMKKNGQKRPYRVHPPRPFVGDHIQQVGGKGARPLRGLTRLPHISDDGNIRCFSGYDPGTGLYNDNPIQLDIPATVSLDEARRLMGKLLYPFSEYTFKNPEQGRATVLAAIFTILERPHLPLAPMFIFRSAMPGTGKGKGLRALTELALATTAAKVTWGGTSEEFEKRLAAVLLQTPSAILIDNANGVMIRGDLLESIITEGYADIRPLGLSEIIRVYNRSFLMLSGNNPIITGDMARRALSTDIEPKSPDPERDHYPFDPVEYVQQHRKELLDAAFSIMRAFRQTGMPQYSELPAVGSFKEWSRKVRDLVYWLTGCDVSEGFRLNKDEDLHRQNDTSLLEALYDYYFDEAKAPLSKEFKSADVMAAYGQADFTPTATPSNRAVRNAINEVLGGRKVDAKYFGYWARRVTGAYCGDFVLEARHDKHAGTNVFTVKCTDTARHTATLEEAQRENAERQRATREAISQEYKAQEAARDAAQAAAREAGRLAAQQVVQEALPIKI